MDANRSQEICARIVPRDADDLDDMLRPHDPGHRPQGRALFPDVEAAVPRIDAFKVQGTVCVGVRVEGHAADVADWAARLAAFALEREVEIVILAQTDVSGYERFGFRVERVAGGTPDLRARCEDQIVRFWGIDLVL